MAVSLYEINFKGKIIVQCELQLNEVQWALIRKYVLSYRGQRSYLIMYYKTVYWLLFLYPLFPTPESFDRKELCSRELEGRDVAQFQEAIEDLYYFEFVYGELSWACSLYVEECVGW